MRFKKRNGHKSNTNQRQREQAQKMSDHYTHLAKEAAGSDDHVRAEYYWQHVDHYKRVLQELTPPPQPIYIDANAPSQTDAQIIEIEELTETEADELVQTNNPSQNASAKTEKDQEPTPQIAVASEE